MRITAIAGGVGGARFVRGLLAHLHGSADPDLRDSQVTVIGNTGDDITLFGLRVCPDLDTVMYTLGGGIDDAQGWGREDETHTVQGELAAYGAQPQWFGLGDRDFATHIARSQLLGLGVPLSQVTEVLCARWGLPELGVRLLPMTDQSVETHVVIEDDEGRRAIHFQEWWVRHQAALARPADRGRRHGARGGRTRRAGRDPGRRRGPAAAEQPGGLDRHRAVGVPGVRDAVRGTRAPVVGRLAADRRASGARSRGRLPGRDRRRHHARSPSPGCTRTSWTAGWWTTPTPTPPGRPGSPCGPGRC